VEETLRREGKEEKNNQSVKSGVMSSHMQGKLKPGVLEGRESGWREPGGGSQQRPCNGQKEPSREKRERELSRVRGTMVRLDGIPARCRGKNLSKKNNTGRGGSGWVSEPEVSLVSGFQHR